MSRRRRSSEEQGLAATRIVAEQNDLEVDTETADWYDAVNPRTGAKYEVKSTHEKLADGSPGRFRLWEDQHRSLVASDAAGVAWYAFVLFDGRGGVAVQLRKPSSVTRAVDGGWNEANHGERPGRQRKLPWDAVMNS